MAEGGEIKSVIPLDLLDDIASRFLLDASQAVLSDSISLCFKTEQAYWFYLDEYVEEDKSLKTLKLDTFAIKLLTHVKIQPPNGGTLLNMLQEFREFKTKVPTYGGIILNDDLTYVLLAQGYCPKDSWGFPKGKINVGEEPHKCAIREVLEETGYDISDLIDPSIFLETIIGERQERLYIIEGVPLNTNFVPKTKGEIKELKWFHISQMQSSKNEKYLGFTKMLYVAMPFVIPLREWIDLELWKRSSLSSKKKRGRRKRHKSLSTCINNTNGSPVSLLESMKKPVIYDKAKPLMNIVIQNSQPATHTDTLLDEASKKFSFKNNIKSSHSPQKTDTKNKGPDSEYFRSEVWKLFKIDQIAVNKVLAEFLSSLR